MAYFQDQTADFPAASRDSLPASQVDVDSRMAFIRRTYVHLFVAILAFVAIEAALLLSPVGATLAGLLFSGGQLGWLVVLGAFMGVSWIADRWAQSDTSVGMQYAGLSLYVVAQAVIFVPLLYVALQVAPSAVPTAAVATIVLFGGMTASTFLTKHDFSWMGPMLGIGGIAALIFIVVGAFTGFSDGLWLFFVCAMIFMSCGYILYTTSNIIHHYNTKQHVAASLALFAAVALLFWYLVQLFMSRD